MQEQGVSSSEDEKNEYESKERRRSGYLIPILILLIILLFGGVSFYLVTQTTYIFPKAAGTNPAEQAVASNPTISLDNSYLFASPLRAKAGMERIRITAFILNSDGLGVSGKQVTMGNSSTTLHFYAISPKTDDTGRAIFDVASDQPGLFIIEASVDGQKIPQRVNITFD